jgi:UDP-MurNAc hydroxylase
MGGSQRAAPCPVKRAAEPYVNCAPRVSVEPKRTSIAFQGDVLDPTASPFGTEPAATFSLPSSANLPKIDAVSGLLSAASHRARISMLIEFVNHASLIISSGDVRLISDPWLEGKVFDEGWDLVATSAMTFDDFKNISHVWFSHEHPDHFSPDNIKKISEEHRRAIHVLFQETKDKKVFRFCQRAGFGQVTELPPQKWLRIGEDIQVLNSPNDTNWAADSWLHVRTPTGTLLNLNDCGAVAQLHTIKQLVGEVDVLATQFSFAQWERNRDAVDHRLAHERHVLEDVKRQIDILKPRYVIPFASFAWFCTDENFYLNAEKNKIRDVAAFIRDNTKSEPIVMYPGDRWIVGEPHDTDAAISRYERDFAQIADPLIRPRTQRNVIDTKTLIEAGNEHRRRLSALGPPLVVRAHLARQCYINRTGFGAGRLSNLLKLAGAHVEPARLFVTDLDQAFKFDLRRGLQPIDISPDACDIMLSSASLAYCFRFPWGGETLFVNGCFQENKDWKNVTSMAYPNRFFKYCSLLRRADLGYRFSWSSAAESLLQKLAFR